MGQLPRFNIESEDPSPHGTNMFLDSIFNQVRCFNIKFNEIKKDNRMGNTCVMSTD